MKGFYLLSVAMAFMPIAGAAIAAPASSSLAQASDRDPEAMQALDRMGEALRKRTAIEVRADITSEEVLTTGQKLQHGGSTHIVARTPNGFQVTIRTDRHQRDIYYDGRKLTLFAPSLGYYASFAAPSTIRETLQVAADKYGLEIPLADMFAWGLDPQLQTRITSAIRVGSDAVNGQNCAHYAMRQAQVDWQIWIREGSDPLPCKLVITSRADPAMPQHTAVYTWIDPKPMETSSFTFTPPAGAHEIVFAPDLAAQAIKRGK